MKLKQHGGYVVMAMVMLSAATAMGETVATEKGDVAATQDLKALLAGLKTAKTLEGQFTCEKSVDGLSVPLVSAGWIRVGKDDKSRVSMRISAQRPYASELILAEGKAIGRSQHETEWAVSSQSSKPGLTAVMAQLGGWSVGEPGKLNELFVIQRPGAEVKVPPRPILSGEPNAADTATVEAYDLVPVNKDLAASVRRVRIGFRRSRGDNGGQEPLAAWIVYASIETAQGDVSRYWFHGVSFNRPLPDTIFKPTADPAAKAAEAGR